MPPAATPVKLLIVDPDALYHRVIEHGEVASYGDGTPILPPPLHETLAVSGDAQQYPITNLPHPSAGGDAATKQYVDGPRELPLDMGCQDLLYVDRIYFCGEGSSSSSSGAPQPDHLFIGPDRDAPQKLVYDAPDGHEFLDPVTFDDTTQFDGIATHNADLVMAQDQDLKFIDADARFVAQASGQLRAYVVTSLTVYTGGTQDVIFDTSGATFKKAAVFDSTVALNDHITVALNKQLRFYDGDAYFYTDADGRINVVVAGSLRFYVNSTTIMTVTTDGLTVTSDKSIFTPDGSAAEPSYAFTTDLDTGIFLKAAGVVGIAAGGAEIFSFSAAGHDAASKKISNLAQPTADQDAATKKYVDDQFGASDTLAEVLGYGNDAACQDIINLDAIYFCDLGSSSSSSGGEPGVIWIRPDRAVVQKLTYHAPGGHKFESPVEFTGDVTSSGQYLGKNGSTSSPSFAFASESNTGIYQYGPSNIGVAIVGVDKIIISDSDVYFADTITMSNKKITNVADPTDAQDAATKSYVDSSVQAQDTLAEILVNGNDAQGQDIVGVCRISFGWLCGSWSSSSSSSDQEGAYIEGNADQIIYNAPGNHVFQSQILVSGGSSSLPSLSFIDDLDTGLYRYDADELGFACGGNMLLRFDAANTAWRFPSNIQIEYWDIWFAGDDYGIRWGDVASWPGEASIVYSGSTNIMSFGVEDQTVVLDLQKTAVVLKTSLITPFAAKTLSYTITDSDHTITIDASNGDRTVTLPTAVGRTGKIFVIKRIDASANTVKVTAQPGQDIDANQNYFLDDQFDSVTVQSDGSNWIVTARVEGSLEPSSSSSA